MGVRVQAKRKYNHRSRCRCKIYSNGGNQNPSKAQKQSPQMQGLLQRRESESKRGAKTIIDVAAGRDIGVLHERSIQKTRLSKLGATKDGSRTEGWLSHPCWSCCTAECSSCQKKLIYTKREGRAVNVPQPLNPLASTMVQENSIMVRII